MNSSSAVNVDEDQRLREIQRQYVEMLDDTSSGGRNANTAVFSPLVDDVIKDFKAVVSTPGSVTPTSIRLILSINDIRDHSPDRARALLVEDASSELLALQYAFKQFVSTTETDLSKEHPNLEFCVGIEGSLGSRHHLSPRTLTSSSLNRLVCVEGIVTTASLVKPKVAHSVHYCPATNKTIERAYSDLTSLHAFPSTAVYPTQDEDGNPLQTEFGLSTYRDHQTFMLQELPEAAPTGQLPRSVDVICDADLVDRVKPGDRVQVVACFRCLPSKHGSGVASGSFRSVLLANNVISAEEREAVTVYTEDIKACKRLAKTQADVFSLLARSLAPSISGHEYVKKALLCQLLSGVEKVLPNGTRLRGDINILLIGDPSVAKSQMLRYALAVAPRAVTTTGRGSSGVGLTAAVTTDQESGDRRLEAGAMVLADRGVVCIDEFDKMSDIDRTAIHEVMEQGRVTISKAGIHASLNARCSVLAAANPVYGRYDAFKTPMENIGLQDSLLSRFDLTFILLDTIDADLDLRIADHVVKTHRYRNPREADGSVTVINTALDDLTTRGAEKDAEAAKSRKSSVWDKYDPLLHEAQSASAARRLLSVDFVRKYIHVAKTLKPKLSDDACEMIGEEYARLRSQDWAMNAADSGQGQLARTQPVTARALETLIRLSTAHAKARLSHTVAAEDALAAIELVQFAYFKTVLAKSSASAEPDRVPATRSRTSDGETESDDDEMTENDPNTANVTSGESLPKRARLAESGAVDMAAFAAKLSALFGEGRHQLEMDVVRKAMARELSLSEAQLTLCIERMTEENKVMLSDGVLYRI